MSDPDQPRVKRFWAVTLMVGLTVVAVSTALLTIAVVFAPEAVKMTAGEVITQAEKTASDVGVIPPPVVVLGLPGGQAELDRCDGTWAEMVDYGVEQIAVPVYSAHNGCGGNAVLALSAQETILVRQLDGSESLYRIESERVIPQITSTTGDLTGLQGEFLLQTCFWDDTTMRIVGLVPAS